MIAYQNIRFTKGYRNTILLDLERFDYISTVNNHIEIIGTGQFPQIKLKSLTDKMSAFFIDSDLELKQLNVDFESWDVPHFISDIHIELSLENELFPFKKIIPYFNIVNADSITYYNSDSNITRNNLTKVLDVLNESSISQCSLYLKYNDDLYSEEFLETIILNPYVKYAIIFESPFNKNFEHSVHYTKNKVTKYIGVDKTSFSCNTHTFSESQKHHTYFNRKLYIGSKGEIKNAPECTEEFGNIQDVKTPEELKSIVTQPVFQKYWYVHKEVCDICKECEFRHICVDNRLPYQRKEDEWFHKQECNYNPYISKWKGEKGYKSLSDCGIISNEKKFSIDHHKILS